MSKHPAASEVAEEILHSVLASPRRERHLLSRTIWRKFGFTVRTENRIQQVSEALRKCDLKVTVEGGAFGKESERDRVVLTYTGSSVPAQAQIPPPPESWFRTMEQRTFQSEREVEHFFAIPLLEHLGYEEGDFFVAYPMVVKPGCGRKRLKVEVDVAVFNGLPHQKDNSLLVVETKSSKTELKEKQRHQACSYGFELHTPYCLLTNGDAIQVLRVSDEKPQHSFGRGELRQQWTNLFALLSKGAMTRQKDAGNAVKAVSAALLMIVGSALLLTVGCTKKPVESADPPRSPAPTNIVAVVAKPDPVADMKKCIQHLNTTGVSDVSYDVQKTDSMISPVTGYVIYTPSQSAGMKIENKIQLAYQDNHWVVQRFLVHGKPPSTLDWTEYPSGAEKVAREVLGLN